MNIGSKILRKINEIWQHSRYGFFYVNDTPAANEFFFLLNKIFRKTEREISEHHVKHHYNNTINDEIFGHIKNLDAFGYTKIVKSLPDDVYTQWVNAYSNVDWDNETHDNMVTFKPWLQYYRLDTSDLLEKTVENFVPYLTGYFRELPILQSAYLWRSIPRTSENQGSQLWHLDHNDTKQVRIFVAIDDITTKNGALELINKIDSDHIYRYLDTINPKNSRKQLHENFSQYPLSHESTRLELKAGDAGLIDTGRAYHRGSRDMTGVRKALVLQFTTPWNLHLPIFRSSGLITPENITNIRERNFVHLQENKRTQEKKAKLHPKDSIPKSL